MKYQIDKIKELYRYDFDTGCVIKNLLPESYFSTIQGYKAHKTRFANKPCGSISRTNSGKAYIQINNGGERLLAHRVVWILVNNEIPCCVDHIDGDGTNNKIENLRNTTLSGNARNQKISRANTTGVTGVYLNKQSKTYPYRAFIKMNKKIISLGTFRTIDEAALARGEANKKYGFHENHGSPR